MRLCPETSCTVSDVALSRAARATEAALPLKSGMVAPALACGAVPWSAAGQVSSSLTAPRSTFVSVACWPEAGVWVQTFQLRSSIWLRARPRASCEVRV